jgi:hypothetical protein
MTRKPNPFFRRLILGLFGVVLLTAAIGVASQTKQLSEQPAVPLDLTPSSFMPVARFDLTPTPTATPPVPPSSVEARLLITPDGGINASTYVPGSFVIINESTSTSRIEQVRIDLSTAMFMDMVFDPYGTAGDTVAKDVQIDSDPGLVGYLGRTYGGPHANGYDVLYLNFNNFDPGESVAFSVDVDPTSIQGVGAPGPFESGSVSGLELVGATVNITFANGLVLTQRTYRIPNSLSGSQALIRQGLPPAPTAEIIGVPSPPATVGSPNQVVRVSGLPYTQVRVLVVEGGLFTDGVPGGGYDLDPYEANSAILVNEYSGTIGSNGLVDIPILVSRSLPQAGLNHIVAIFENYYGMRGPTSAVIVLELN